MRIIYRYLLSILLLLGSCPLYPNKVSTDTLLMHLYNQAAGLMEEGNLDKAQHIFDSAFAVSGAKQSSVYPILLNEQATLLVYKGKFDQAFSMKRMFFLTCPR